MRTPRKQYSIAITDEEYDLLKKIANKESRTLSGTMLYIVRLGLEKYKKAEAEGDNGV